MRWQEFHTVSRQDSVEAAWAIVDPVLDPCDPRLRYECGSPGPSQARRLVGGGWASRWLRRIRAETRQRTEMKKTDALAVVVIDHLPGLRRGSATELEGRARAQSANRETFCIAFPGLSVAKTFLPSLAK